MSQPVISVENLSKSYQLGVIGTGTFRGDIQRWWAQLRGLPDPYLIIGEADHGNRQGETIWALKDINFQVKQGEALGIIGRNGAGKSTLLKILSRVTAPTRGLVKIKGRIASLLEVGTGFHPELTGRENIYLNGAILGMKNDEIDRKFEEIVDFSGVEQFIDTPVKRYSSGMYVRLAFAVAAHLDPEILVVDEVLAVGDVEFQKKCLGKMNNAVTSEGRTVLFVSHNMGAIRKLCTKGILLDHGVVTINSNIEDVSNKYLLDNNSDMSPNVFLKKKENYLANGLVVRFFGQNGEPKAQFKLLEPWNISLEFEIYQSLEQVIAAVGITNIDSIPLTTFWSKPSNLTPGRYKVDFSVNLPLSACELRFIVGISSYERSIYYEEGVGLVSISEVSTGEQPIRSRGSGLLAVSQDKTIQPF